MIDMIKHLYQNEETMESSVEGIASIELDVNRLKIDRYLNIKKEEENIKFLSHALPKTKFTFIKLTLGLAAFFLLLFILEIT
jgi:hypothetical protein